MKSKLIFISICLLIEGILPTASVFSMGPKTLTGILASKKNNQISLSISQEPSLKTEQKLEVEKTVNESGIEIYTVNFGKAKEGDILKYNFEIKNDRDKTLTITKVVPTCGCTKAKASPDIIEPNKSTFLEVEITTKDLKGQIEKTIYVHTDNPKKSIIQLKLKAEVI